MKLKRNRRRVLKKAMLNNFVLKKGNKRRKIDRNFTEANFKDYTPLQ
jgi:hypothetical protein